MLAAKRVGHRHVAPRLLHAEHREDAIASVGRKVLGVIQDLPAKTPGRPGLQGGWSDSGSGSIQWRPGPRGEREGEIVNRQRQVGVVRGIVHERVTPLGRDVFDLTAETIAFLKRVLGAGNPLVTAPAKIKRTGDRER